jgi:hypothetical protein
VRVARSLTPVLLPAALAALAGCSGLVFESMPATPGAVLAFKLRTLEAGRTVRIQRVDASMVEGRVVEPGPGRAIVETGSGRDTVDAEAYELSGAEPAGETVPLWYLAPLVAKAALAGGVFGALIHAASPAWNQVYPVPAGARP